MVVSRARGRRQPLTVAEIAEAAALGDLVAAMSVLARLVPAGGIGVLLTAFPMVVLGHRRRARVCAISVTTASTVAFLGGGLGPAVSAVGAGVLGSLVGIGVRRGWSVGRTVATGLLCLGVPYSAVAVGLFWALADARALALAQLANSWSGAERLASAAGVPHPVLEVGRDVVAFAVTRWWLLLPLMVTAAVLVGVFVTTLALRPPLRRTAPLLPRPTARELDEPAAHARSSPRCPSASPGSGFATRGRRRRPSPGSTCGWSKGVSSG